MRILSIVRTFLNLPTRIARRNRLKMSTTTGFFRNPNQLEIIYNHVPAPKRVYVFASSNGCEVYSMAMFYASRNADKCPRFLGFDIEPACVKTARNGVYHSREVDYYGDGRAFIDPYRRYLGNLGCDTWRVERTIMDRGFIQSLGPADIVCCQNVLIHMSESDNLLALSLLCRLLSGKKLLVIAGMRPSLRCRITRALGLNPVVDGCREVHEAQRDLRHAWDHSPFFLRPYIALPPFTECQDWQRLYSTMFYLE
jgi:hypothetical protein